MHLQDCLSGPSTGGTEYDIQDHLDLSQCDIQDYPKHIPYCSSMTKFPFFTRIMSDFLFLFVKK